FRPRIVLRAVLWWTRKNFHLHETLAAVPHGGADAVRAGIAAADDHDVFAGGGNEIPVLVSVENAPGVRGEKFHGKLNALERAAFDGQVARLGRAGGKHDGVKFLQEFFGGKIFTDLGVADELDAFGFHLFEAAQDDLFLVELHVGNPVHEQAAGAVGAFKHG